MFSIRSTHKLRAHFNRIFKENKCCFAINMSSLRRLFNYISVCHDRITCQFHLNRITRRKRADLWTDPITLLRPLCTFNSQFIIGRLANLASANDSFVAMLFVIFPRYFFVRRGRVLYLGIQEARLT